MSDLSHSPQSGTKKSIWPIVVGGLLMMLIFYMGSKYLIATAPADADEDSLRGIERMEILKAHLEAEAPKLTTFAWIDRNAGTVQIPVDLAMELTVASLAARSDVRPAYPINPEETSAPAEVTAEAGEDAAPTAAEATEETSEETDETPATPADEEQTPAPEVTP